MKAEYMKKSIRNVLTPSLLLRPFTLNDVSRVYRLSLEDGVRKWLPDQVYADVDTACVVVEYLMRQYSEGVTPNDAPIVLGVCLRDTGELIGHVGLSPLNDGVEIGYAIADRHQTQGFATEAVHAVSVWALRNYKLKHIIAVAAVDNFGSCRVLEKAGFVLADEKPRKLHGTLRLVRTYKFSE